jgi:hypothetical protein
MRLASALHVLDRVVVVLLVVVRVVVVVLGLGGNVVVMPSRAPTTQLSDRSVLPVPSSVNPRPLHVNDVVPNEI